MATMIAILWLSSTSAQTEREIQLRNTINTSQNDSLVGDSYYDLALMTRFENLERAKLYCDSGRQRFLKLGFEGGEKKSVYINAALAYTEGNFEKALDLSHLYYDWAKSTDNLPRLSYAIGNLAKFNREAGNLGKAIAYSLEGKELSEKIRPYPRLRILFSRIG